MSTKLSNIGFITFEWGRQSSLGKAALAALVVAGLLLYVGAKVKIYQLGYQIEDLKKEKRELERANRSLTIEASSLTAPARIEEIAVKKLGMVRPPKDRIVVVKRKADGEPADAAGR